MSLERIERQLIRIDKTLAAQHIVLKEHIRRTELLEGQLEPIKKHVAMVNGALKFIGLLGIISGILEVGILWLKNR
jgi:hypothetical protein